MTVYVGTLRRAIADLQTGFELAPVLEDATPSQLVALRRLALNVIEQADVVRSALDADIVAIVPNPTAIPSGMFAPAGVAAINAAIESIDQFTAMLDVHGAARRIQINLGSVAR